MLLAQQPQLPGYIQDQPTVANNFFGTLPPNLIPDFFDLFNPKNTNVSLGLLFARIGLFAIAISGSVFLFKLISGGYSYLTSAGDQEKIQKGTKEITNAAIGLFVIISSYFIMQIVQVIFGIKIL